MALSAYFGGFEDVGGAPGECRVRARGGHSRGCVNLSVQLKAFRSGKRLHEIMSLIAKDLTDLAAWYASIRITTEIPE